MPNNTAASLAPLYRITGTLIPVLSTDESDQALVAAAPLAVDLIMRSTHPDFPARAALWVFALGYAAWRWETPPEVTRLEEEGKAES